jgi:hypothetical protein
MEGSAMEISGMRVSEIELGAPQSPGPRVLARRARGRGRGVYTLSGHDWALLAQAMRCAQTCDELLALLEREGWLVESPGGPAAHPAVAELRSQRVKLTRLFSALSNPLRGDDDVPATNDDVVIRLR